MGLIKDIQSDLDNAAVRIVGDYRARLHAAAVKLCGDAGEADDLVMRTFDAAFRETSSYDETKGELYPWLVGVMHRIHAKSNRRLVDRGTVPVDPAVLQDLAGVTEDSVNKVLEDSDRDALRAAMERLDPEYKRVLVMHYFGELPVKRIATVLNMPVGTVLWRLSIARKILARDLGEKLGKKPLAVLFAALLGVCSLFGAWQAGLLEPLFSQRGEAESFPLQKETLQSGDAATSSGEAESFPLHGGAVSTQLQSQSETSLTQEESQSEATKEQTMNLKTVKTLAASAVVAANAAVANATTITIKNFDEDLATVYVNDVAVADGETVEVEGTVKVELKDFRSDYYFALAPESLADRTLAFASWEGVPEGYEGANPATFTVEGNLTITPNVNVKGYSWSIVDGVLQNEKFRWNFTKDDAKRAVTLKSCLGNTVGATTCTLVLDAVQRVICDGKVYTITAFDANPDCVFDDSYICQVALPSRFETFGYRLIPSTKGNKSFSIGSDFYLYLSDVKAPSYGDLAYYSGLATLKGPANNFVAQHTVSIASQAFRGRTSMTGTLLLDSIQTITANAFLGCSGLEGLDLTSTALTTIGANAFSGCSKVKNVTIGSSVLTSVGGGAFPSGITNFTFLGAAPAATVLDKVVDQQSVAVAKTCRLTVDGERADWWARTVAPNGEEIAAGLPENCMGVYKDAGDNRRAWVVSSKPLAGTLIETDMLNRENEGYTMHTGLETGDKLTLTAPEGRGMCELQHLVNGVWTKLETIRGTSISYQHNGELTRAVWRVDGVALNASTTGYGGKLRIEVKSGGVIAGEVNIYTPGSEVWITAVGAAERPRSVISRWTGVPAGQETDETVKLVLTDDVTVNALFRPLEWVYDPATRKITDGEYTSSARAADLIGEDGMSFQKFEGANYELWLDFSLPIYNPEDPEKAYWIAGVTADRNTTWTRVRFSPHIVSLPSPIFLNSGVLNEVEHFAQVRVEALSEHFFNNYGKGGPIRERVYEAEDFYPPTLKRFGRYAFCSDTPFLKGKMTVGLNDLTGFTEDLLPRCAAVTNWIFTAEDLPAIGWNSASFAPTTVTFASTNLTVNANGASVFRYGEVKDVYFLAHAPSADAMDTLFSTYPQSMNVVIHASRYAPGWKALRAKGYRSMDEWKACPANCWGIYQTADGKKRFYLVQQNSKYDVRNGMMLILK